MSAAPSSTKVQDLLNAPEQWPASFPKPAIGTRVLTYVFDPKDAAKVQLLLDFIKDKFPAALVSVVKDQDGFSSVTITQTSTSEQPAPDTTSATAAASDDCSNCPYGTTCAGTSYCTGP